jgi:hypothetical protein
MLYGSEARAQWGFHPDGIEMILRFEMAIYARICSNQIALRITWSAIGGTGGDASLDLLDKVAVALAAHTPVA